MSLDDFAKSCQIENISKSIFCYEKYRSIDEMKQDSTFPEYSAFKSSLRTRKKDSWEESFFDVVNTKLAAGAFHTVMEIAQYYGFEFDKLSMHCKIENMELKSSSESSTSFLLDVLHTCPKSYEVSKEYFNTKCTNMLQYLEEYNLLDVRSRDIIFFYSFFLCQNNY